MSAKEELHDLVDRLGDERAQAALAYLRRLLQEDERGADRAEAGLGKRMAPAAMSGSAFFSEPAADLETLARQQGVSPVQSFKDLLGDFWPEGGSPDEFVDALREWRRRSGLTFHS